MVRKVVIYMDGEYLWQVLFDGWDSDIIAVEYRGTRGFFSVRLKWGCCGLVAGTELIWGMTTNVMGPHGVRVFVWYRVLEDGTLVREDKSIDVELGRFDEVINLLEGMGWGINAPGGL